MTDKNHEKIWKEIKPHIDLIEGYMNAFIHLAQDTGNKEDEFRLSNLKRSFCRGIMIAASAKYLPMKNKPTREGYDLVAFVDANFASGENTESYSDEERIIIEKMILKVR